MMMMIMIMMMMMMIIINCGDGTNSPDVSATIAETFFFIILMLFHSVFVLSCYLFAKWARLYILLFFCLQILTSAPAVLMTVTVHLLLVPTQWDPLVVHVIILPAEMAELAIYLQVTRKIYSVTKPAAIHL